MSNMSLIAAFERMWQHIVALVDTKADVSHTHNTYATNTKNGTATASDNGYRVISRVNLHNRVKI